MKKKSFFKYKFIRKYGVDLWGYLTSCSISRQHFVFKMFKMFCFKYRKKIWILRWALNPKRLPFHYSRIIPPKIRYISYYQKYIKNLRLLLIFRAYYGDMTIKKFRRYLKKINIRRADFISRICILLEGRLDILLCRLNFVRTPRDARPFIKSKKIWINEKIVDRLNYQLYINDVIIIDNSISSKFYNILRTKLRKKKILFNYPRYLEVNYKLMKCIFIMYPKRQDINSTWRIDFSFLRNLI